MALVASILATTACQKDNADDAWWKAVMPR